MLRFYAALAHLPFMSVAKRLHPCEAHNAAYVAEGPGLCSLQ